MSKSTLPGSPTCPRSDNISVGPECSLRGCSKLLATSYEKVGLGHGVHHAAVKGPFPFGGYIYLCFSKKGGIPLTNNIIASSMQKTRVCLEHRQAEVVAINEIPHRFCQKVHLIKILCIFNAIPDMLYIDCNN